MVDTIPTTAQGPPRATGRLPTGAARAMATGRGLFAILAAATAVRVLYLVFYLRSPLAGIFRVDQLYYRTWGLEIAGGSWLGREAFEQGPLYAYLLGLVYRLIGPRDSAVLALQLLAGVLTAGLVFMLARRLFCPRAAVFSGALAALYGPAVFYECMIMKTFLEPLLILAALYAGVRAPDSRRPMRWWAAAGAAVGLACLVREVHVLLLLPLAAAPWITAPRGASRSRRAAAALAPVAACLLVLLPVSLRNQFVAGEFIAVSAAGGENFYLAYGPYARAYYSRPPFLSGIPYQEHQDFRDETLLRTGRPHRRGASSRYWFRNAVTSVLEQPGRTLALVFEKTLLLLKDFELPDSENYPVTRGFVAPLRVLPTFGWIVGAGLLGIARAARRPRRFFLPLGFAAALALGVVLTFNLGRYRSAFTVMLLLFCGRALASLPLLTRPRFRIPAAAGLLSLLLISLLSFSLPPGLDPVKRDREFSLLREGIVADAEARAMIPTFEAALESGAANPLLWVNYGTTLAQIGRLPEAGRAYERAVQLNPQLAEARFLWARLLFRQGRLAETAEQARAALAVRPGDARSHLLLGRVALWAAAAAPGPEAARIAVQESAGHLHRAIAADPRLAEAHLYLGRAYYLGGLPRRALESLATALRLDPSCTEAAYLQEFVRSRR